MEQLAQKSAKYVYITLLVGTLFHLGDAIFGLFNGGCRVETSVLILLSVINAMLLGNSLMFNIKQRFTECKVNAKILRFTLALLLVFHTICVWDGLYLITLRDNITSFVVIELFLTYRINCIEHLEKLANQFVKINMMNKKEGN